MCPPFLLYARCRHYTQSTCRRQPVGLGGTRNGSDALISPHPQYAPEGPSIQPTRPPPDFPARLDHAQARCGDCLGRLLAQPNQETARQQLAEVVQAMEPRWPKAAEVLVGGAEDVLAYMAFPGEHWTRIYSANPLERLNREVKQRSDAVGIFPNEETVLRLVGSVLIEIADEWTAGWRYFGQESMRKSREPESDLLMLPSPLRLAPVH